MNEKLKPWERDKSEVQIIQNYSAKIVWEDDNMYHIEFWDHDGSIVEAGLTKEKFDRMPYPVISGSVFVIVIYKIVSEMELKMEVWPIMRFWHSSYQQKNNPGS